MAKVCPPSRSLPRHRPAQMRTAQFRSIFARNNKEAFFRRNNWQLWQQFFAKMAKFRFAFLFG
jgi:hypothetical protein